MVEGGKKEGGREGGKKEGRRREGWRSHHSYQGTNAQRD